MSWCWVFVGVLAAWRVTHLLGSEDGPWGALARLRRAAGTGGLGRLLDCFYCLSLWIALPFALAVGETWKERLLLWPAVSGGAILLQRATARAGDDDPTRAATYIEDAKEPADGMLRQDEGGVRSTGDGGRPG